MPLFDDIPDLGPPRLLAPDSRVPVRPGSASPTRGQLTQRRLAVVLLSVAWFAVQFFVFGLRADLGRLPLGYLVGLVLLPASVGLLAIAAAVRGGRFGLGIGATLLVALTLGSALVYSLAGLSLPFPYEGGRTENLASHARCLGLIALWAGLPLLGAGWVLRRSFAGSAVWRSALLAGGSGLTAAALLTLHCSFVSKLHLAVAHGCAPLVFALLGGFLLSRFTRS